MEFYHQKALYNTKTLSKLVQSNNCMYIILTHTNRNIFKLCILTNKDLDFVKRRTKETAHSPY